jgi:hypothetical protein
MVSASHDASAHFDYPNGRDDRRFYTVSVFQSVNRELSTHTNGSGSHQAKLKRQKKPGVRPQFFDDLGTSQPASRSSVALLNDQVWPLSWLRVSCLQ